MVSVLTDIRVLDLSSGQVGGVASMILGDFGADVVKIERPGGDPWRSAAAAPMWLRGKRSVEIDLARPDGQARLARLAADADVVLSSFRPAQAARLGADYDTLRAAGGASDRLIYCSITGFGPTGDYADWPGYEGVVAAKSGRMVGFDGQRLRPGPGFAAVPVGSHGASQGAVHGILAALIERDRCGRGQIVETSILQGLMPFDLLQLLLTQLHEREPDIYPAINVFGGGMPTLNYHPVLTADGRWIQLGNLLEHLFYAFMDAADLTHLFVEEQWQRSQVEWTPDALEAMRDRILERMQERTADEWMDIFRASGNVAAEPFTPTEDALDNADMLANGDIVHLDDPALGTVEQLGPIAHLRETPARIERPAPAVGEANGFAWSPRDPSPNAVSANGSVPSGKPLDGFTILEFATIIATPIGVSMLADLGARVIKVEPIGGDPFRGMGGGPLRGLLASKTNAAKESICIDLKSPDGQAIVADLIANADAIVHNYRPGVPERLGIGYETARAIRGDIVWVSANGYGPDSDGARRPSAHPIPGAAVGGALYQAGAATPPAGCESLEEIREVSRQLMRANEANPDPNTGVLVASATLLGLYAQRRYGVGQQIFVNMLAANAYANADDFVRYAGKPPRRPVDGELYGTHPLYRLYPTDAGWVFLGAPTDRDWRRFTAAAAPGLADDPRFATADARAAHESDLIDVLSALFAARPASEWEADLAPQGIGCVVADGGSPGDFFAHDPHVAANRFAPVAEHQRLGAVRRWGALTHCAGGRDDLAPGVLAGAETDAILHEIGKTPDQIAALRQAGAVWSEPVHLAADS